MQTFPALALYLAAILTFCGAALHFACVFWGANGFRFLGAGKSMVAMSEKGLWYPNLMAISVGLALSLFSFYAYCAASATAKLPFTPFLLASVATVLLARGLAFPWLKSSFAGNSDTFWYVSSGFCLVLGGLYAIGAFATWQSPDLSGF